MMELFVGLNLARQMIEGRSKNKYRFDMQVSVRHMAGPSMSLNPSNHLRAVQKTALIRVCSELFGLEWERAAVIAKAIPSTSVGDQTELATRFRALDREGNAAI